MLCGAPADRELRHEGDGIGRAAGLSAEVVQRQAEQLHSRRRGTPLAALPSRSLRALPASSAARPRGTTTTGHGGVADDLGRARAEEDPRHGADRARADDEHVAVAATRRPPAPRSQVSPWPTAVSSSRGERGQVARPRRARRAGTRCDLRRPTRRLIELVGLGADAAVYGRRAGGRRTRRCRSARRPAPRRPRRRRRGRRPRCRRRPR